ELRRSISITAMSFDEYCRESALEVNFIKMDVQGAEAKVLRGMQGLLSKSSRLRMLFEFWPLGLQRAGDSAERAIQFLVNSGFTFQECNEVGRRTELVSPSQLLSDVTVEEGNQTNLLASRPDACAYQPNAACAR